MNKSLPTAASSNSILQGLLGGLISMVMFVLVGCGGSQQQESTVVSPPEHSAAQSEVAGESQPPGSIVLPEGEIPPPESTDTPKPESGGIEMPDSVEIPEAETGSTEPPLQPQVLYATWEEIETVAKSSGRITVVDLWSLACEPCLKEFPGLVALHESMGASVQCVAVDLDYDGRKTRPPEYYEERVLDFLGSVGATGFPTYISQTPSDDVFAATQLPSIPAVLIYDANGEMVKVFVDAGASAGFSYEKDVQPLVNQLVSR